jgi:hypothetical protein
MDPQSSLLEVEPPHRRPARTTSKGIGAGDIVLVDKKGRRFHALVTELQQLESGRFELALRPLDSRVSWRVASVREVVEVWRRAGARPCSGHKRAPVGLDLSSWRKTTTTRSATRHSREAPRS